VDAERGPIIEPYGPVLRGAQTGPLRGITVGGLNAEWMRHAGCCETASPGTTLPMSGCGSDSIPTTLSIGLPRKAFRLNPPGLRGIGIFGEHLTSQPACDR